MAETRRENRPWGHFEVLLDEPGYKVKRLVVEPGARLSLQFHRHRSEHWHIAVGKGLATVGEQETLVQEGRSVDIPSNTQHRIENTGESPLAFIEIQRGERLDEDDIVRVQDDYGRAPKPPNS